MAAGKEQEFIEKVNKLSNDIRARKISYDDKLILLNEIFNLSNTIKHPKLELVSKFQNLIAKSFSMAGEIRALESSKTVSKLISKPAKKKLKTIVLKVLEINNFSLEDLVETDLVSTIAVFIYKDSIKIGTTASQVKEDSSSPTEDIAGPDAASAGEASPESKEGDPENVYDGQEQDLDDFGFLYLNPEDLQVLNSKPREISSGDTAVNAGASSAASQKDGAVGDHEEVDDKELEESFVDLSEECEALLIEARAAVGIEKESKEK